MPKPIKTKGQKIIEAPLIKNPLAIKKENFFASFLYRIRTLFIGLFYGQKNFNRIVFVLAVISIFATVYFFFKFNELKKNPSKEIDKQTKDLVSQVSKLVVLPQNETPTIATVFDPEKLKDQPFFANAKKGYKVLIYTNAKKAILYDPFENKIIEIAPINVGNKSQGNSTQAPPIPKEKQQ